MRIREEEQYWPGTNIPQRRVWHTDGKKGRRDGPARIEFYPNGGVKDQTWYLEGKVHRVGGPANQRYHQNGSLKSEEWALFGRTHRLDGPAIIWYDPEPVGRWAICGISMPEEMHRNWLYEPSKAIFKFTLDLMPDKSQVAAFFTPDTPLGKIILSATLFL